MDSLLELLRLRDQGPDLVEDGVLHLVHLYRVLRLLEHLADALEGLVVVWSQECERLALAPNSGCPTTSVNVYLGVEGALVVQYVAHEGNIESSRRHIGAD